MEDSGNLSLCVCHPDAAETLVKEKGIPETALVVTKICPVEKTFVIGKDDFLIFLMEKGDIYGTE